MSDNVIILKDVWKIYRSGGFIVEALRGVTLHITRGEIALVHGPSGSGKTTLLKIIAGLERPDKGSVIVDGYELTVLDEEGLALIRNTVVGYIPQDYGLVEDFTAWENVELPLLIAGFPKDRRESAVASILEYVGLTHRKNVVVRKLSGGERQRVAIARALVNTPSVLLADEPTANLDWENTKVIMDLFKEIKRDFNTSIVIVSHDPRIIDYADKFILLYEGRVKEFRERSSGR
ncbi:MAG: ABC transporter ATP-binding protein [Sulfolobales archaeon]